MLTSLKNKAGTILAAWEHNHIKPLAEALGVSSHKIPTWSGSDFDTCYELQFDHNQKLTSFKVSAEGYHPHNNAKSPALLYGVNTSNTTLDGQIIIPDQHSKGNRVIILPANKHSWVESDILWEWPVSVSIKSWGKHISDARRVSYNGTDHILVAGSSGGLALVEVITKKLVYWNTPSGTPHAAALLPDDLIAIANPADSGGGKPSVQLFDMRLGNNKPHVQELDQGGCHGIVFDSQNKCVWAWGGSSLHRYAYHNRKLSPAGKFSPPSSWNAGGGHALASMETNKLLLSYNGGLAIFDIDTQEFSHYNTKVGGSTKGVSYNPHTEEVIYCHEDHDTGDSRSHYVHSVQDKDRSLKDGVWYRARWYYYNHL